MFMSEFHFVPNGGINTYGEINDNQGSYGENVWYKGGLIQRDKISSLLETEEEILDIFPKQGTIKMFVEDTNAGTYVLTPQNLYFFYEENGNTHFTAMNFYNTENELITPSFNSKSAIIPSMRVKEGTSYTLVQIMILADDKVYYNNFYLGTTVRFETLYRYSLVNYRPTNRINCNYSSSGDFLESANLINELLTYKYTTTNTNPTTITYDTSLKLFDLKYYDTSDNAWQGYFYNVTENGANFNIQASSYEGPVYLVQGCYVDFTTGTITIPVGLANSSSLNITNNLELTFKRNNYDINDISKCSLWSYFGGDRQGLSSGNRLFLSGNPKYPNRIWWSASNNSFYFPEDNYNDIGDSSPIIGFGKVFDSLVVYKKNATYRIKYAYDNENAIAYFTVSEISNTYGCDMPKSIQLINNDLVWCHSKHGVLLLKSTTSSVQDERVIRKISRNINSLLFTELSDVQNHCSLDYDGYYYLFVNDKVFLWDYNTTPYSYQNTDEEQKRLAWYYWTIPIKPSICGISTEPILCFSDLTPTLTGIYRFGGTEAISCTFKSKPYDLGHKEITKALNYVNLFGSFADLKVKFFNHSEEEEMTYGTMGDTKAVPPFRSFQKFIQFQITASSLNLSDIAVYYLKGRAR